MALKDASLLCGYRGLLEQASAYPNSSGAAGPHVSSRVTTHTSKV